MLASITRTVRRRQPGSTQRWVSASAARRRLDFSSTGEVAIQEDVEPQPEAETTRDVREDPSYEQWLATTGRQYKRADRRNWLGGTVVRPRFPLYAPSSLTNAGRQPFPLNPSFKPPTPLSDARRQQIFDQFIFDPKVNNVRALAARHGISIKRVDAILRLKGLEASWKKVRICLSILLTWTPPGPLE